MKRFAVVLTVVLGLVGAAPAKAGQAGAEVWFALQSETWVRVVVSLKDGKGSVSGSRRPVDIDRVRGEVLRTLGPDEFRITAEWTMIPALAGEVTRAGLEKLLSDPDVLRVDVDAPGYIQLAESVPMIHADELHSLGFTGRGVTVAVLDTGIDGSHADLSDDIVDEACFCTSANGAGCCPNGSSSQTGAASSRDDNGHGTHVSGIITSAGRVAPQGMAPDAKIVSIKVLDRQGSGLSSGMLSGLDYILKSRPEVKVVNFSLGLANVFDGNCDSAASFTTAFASAINQLRARGTITFASSGNGNQAQMMAVPACISAAVSVGAVYDDNVGTISFGCIDGSTDRDRVTCFSNSSSTLDILAPGAGVTSTAMGGGTQTQIGTSQACPVAAGVAAALLSANPAATPDRIESALKNTGTPITDSKNGRRTPRINARAALDAVR